MSGRKALSLPEPNFSGDKEGKVVVRIWVNRNGDVIRVEAPAKGSTMMDATMVNIAKEAALKAKFSANETAPQEQEGTITYVFKIHE